MDTSSMNGRGEGEGNGWKIQNSSRKLKKFDTFCIQMYHSLLHDDEKIQLSIFFSFQEIMYFFFFNNLYETICIFKRRKIF